MTTTATMAAVQFPRVAKKAERPILYKSPIALAEKRVGRFGIEHHVFTEDVVLVSLREALLTGMPPTVVKLDAPLRCHKLVEYEGKLDRMWMSDEPQELRQAAEWLLGSRVRGDVLVGGLGLGIVASWLVARPRVGRVDVVERSQDVIDLVYGQQRGGVYSTDGKKLGGYNVICSDIAAFLKNVPDWTWDFCFLDTWQGTGEGTWWEEVMPLRRIIGNRFGRKRVTCWAEDQMLAQVARAFVVGNASMQERLTKQVPNAKAMVEQLPAVPSPDGFQRTQLKVRPFGRHWHYSHFPEEMTSNEIHHFLTRVGLQDWEERWGEAVDGWREPQSSDAFHL